MPVSWKKRLKNLLFIDIKTVAGAPSYNDLDERIQQQWGQKTSYFQNDENWSAAKWYDTRASYYAEYGKIVCIGIGGLYWDDDNNVFLKVKTLANDDEEALLGEFINIIEKYPSNELILCAHNGKEFDYPYLCRRMLVHGHQLPAALRLSGRKPWDIPHQDVLEMWRFGDSRHFVPLDLLAAVLNLPTQPLELTGDQTSLVYYQKMGLSKVREYARASIVTLVQVYLRLLGAPLVEEQRITRLE
ncbi:ribonuclease H-like domain-containing protein [Larkinella insperata]|uniref:Ribonuclease H-like domain-containing protein n=1 Tax=Larkinella insperata TaxID=332158 RepID=A0ABW3Q6D2_9BACT|nr:ribonuclease H-like domain-containing protein [Larkinella insperata]